MSSLELRTILLLAFVMLWITMHQRLTKWSMYWRQTTSRRKN